jgi:hypothetical protein
MMTELFTKIGANRRLSDRARSIARLILGAGKNGDQHAYAVCDVMTHVATLVGMSANVRAALGEVCERWDGRGGPRGTSGQTLALASRVVNLANITEIAHHRGGQTQRAWTMWLSRSRASLISNRYGHSATRRASRSSPLGWRPKQ